MGWRARAEILVCISNNCDSYQKVSTAKAMENKWYQTLNMRKPRREFEMCFAPYLYLVRVAWKVFYKKWSVEMNFIQEKSRRNDTNSYFGMLGWWWCVDDNNSSSSSRISEKWQYTTYSCCCCCFCCLTLNHKIGRKQSYTIISYQIYFNCGGAATFCSISSERTIACMCVFVFFSCSIWSKTTPIH